MALHAARLSHRGTLHHFLAHLSVVQRRQKEGKIGHNACCDGAVVFSYFFSSVNVSNSAEYSFCQFAFLWFPITQSFLSSAHESSFSYFPSPFTRVGVCVRARTWHSLPQFALKKKRALRADKILSFWVLSSLFKCCANTHIKACVRAVARSASHPRFQCTLWLLSFVTRLLSFFFSSFCFNCDNSSSHFHRGGVDSLCRIFDINTGLSIRTAGQSTSPFLC